MDPVSLSIVVGRPREEVFAYLADIANHAEFTDHFLVDWHLTRTDPVGVGAGARFRITAPLQRFSWAGATIIELEPPRRIVLGGRGGKYNRIRMLSVYVLEPSGAAATRVELSTETVPVMLSDRLLEALGSRFWLRRQNHKALRRLRSILEDGEGRGVRPTIAGL